MQVEVEVVDRLAAPSPDVRDEPVAALGDPLRAREVGRDREQPAEQRAVRLGQVRRGRDVAARDEQDMGRRARRDVADGDDQVVLVEPVDGISPATIRQKRQSSGIDPSAMSCGIGRHHSTGLELIRNPMVPTSPAIRYDM